MPAPKLHLDVITVEVLVGMRQSRENMPLCLCVVLSSRVLKYLGYTVEDHSRASGLMEQDVF